MLMLGAGSPAWAGSGIFNGFVRLNTAGTANLYDLNGTTQNTQTSLYDFNGTNLGTYGLGAQSLTLIGGEAQTFKDGTCDVMNARVRYRVYPVGSPSGTYGSMNLPYSCDQGGSCGIAISGTGTNQKWQELSSGSPVNLLTGLTAGTQYTLEVYLESDYQFCGNGTNYWSDGGANYKASFYYATLCGTNYTIDPSSPASGTNFQSFTTAINALNSFGVTCPTTFTVANGAVFTENPPLITATGTAANPIIFQEALAAGTNPVINAVTNSGTTAGDYILGVSGSDYLTFDGIDVSDANSAAGTVTQQREYGYVLWRASTGNGVQNIKIKNCTVTLNKSNGGTMCIWSANFTAAGVSTTAGSPAGANSNNKFDGNTLTNAFRGIVLDVTAGTTLANIDTGNEIGTTAGNTINNIGGSGAVYGIRLEGQANMKIENNTITIPTGSTNSIRGIGVGVGTGAGIYGTVLINNNTISITSSSANPTYGIHQAGTTNIGNVTITNNKVQNSVISAVPSTLNWIEDGSTSTTTVVTITGNQILTNSTTSTGTVNAIYRSGANSASTTVSGNTISSNTVSGAAATFNGVRVANQQSGTIPVTASTNTITGNQLTGASGTMNCINLGTGATTLNLNTITNNTIPNTSGAGVSTITGYFQNVFPLTDNFTNNTITGLSIGGAATGSSHYVRAVSVHGSASNVQTYTQNTIGNLSITGTVNGAVAGLYFLAGGGTGSIISRNKIYDLSAVGANGTVSGITIATTVTLTISNNLIGDLRAPAANAILPVTGITLVAGTSVNLYYNTVYLAATSTGGTFGTAGLFVGNTAPTLDLRNNIFINNSTPNGGSGITAAFRRNGTNGTNSNVATANNNLYYAGTPSATRVIFTDATVTYSTLALYKAALSPKETASVTENTTFLSLTGSNANFLHIDPAVGTQAESGGANITGFTTDFDADIRQGNAGYAGVGTAPDIGADEGNFLLADITGPAITYTALVNDVSTSTGQSLTATITDVSGIGTLTNAPRLYYRKSISPTYVFVNAASVVGSAYTFNILYSTIGGVAAGDIIQYYVAAQDAPAPAVGPPNVSTNPIGGSGTNPPGTTAPASPNSYPILTGFSGTINVGPGQTYPSFTAAGGLFAALNAGALTGNLTVLVTGDITIENGVNELLPATAVPAASNFTISIQPSAAALRTISGAIAGGIRLNGADLVAFDGRFNQTGTSQFLRFRNTLTSAPTFYLGQDANNNTIRNCVIEGATSSATSGVVVIGTSTVAAVNTVSAGLSGNHNFQLLNCDVRDRSDAVGVPANALYSAGSAGAAANAGETITGNNFYNFSASGILLTSAGNGNFWTISTNSFYATTTATTAQTPIDVSPTGAATNWLISGNYVGGSAPLATGTWTNSANQPFTAISVSGGTSVGAPTTTIQNNVVQNIALTNAGASVRFVGIGIGNGAYTYLISGNTITSVVNAGAGGTGTGTGNTVGIYSNSTATGAAGQTITANIVSNLSITQTSAGNLWGVGILVNASGGSSFNTVISRNRVFGLTSTNTQTSSGLIGVHLFNGSWILTNNQITLTNGANGNGQTVYGLLDNTLTSQTEAFYFNSVYVGGTATTGALKSYAYQRAVSSTLDLRNNVLVNVRTGGTGGHFAVGLSAVGSLTADRNDLYATAAATQAEIGTTAYTFTTYKTATGQDANSKNALVRFVDLPTGNLDLSSTTNCQLDNAGVAITGISGEYSNAATSRATTPDIGSDEFSYTQQTAVLTTTGTVCAPVTGSVTINGAGNGPWSVVLAVNGVNQSAVSAAASPFTFATTGGNTYTLVSVGDGYGPTATTGCALAVSGGPLTVNARPTASFSAVTSPICSGTSTTVMGTLSGTGPFTGSYTVNGGGAIALPTSGSTFTINTGPLTAAATYNITVLSDANCAATAFPTAVTVNVSALPTFTTSKVDVTCNGAATGSITVTAAGGAGSYQFSSNNGGTWTSFANPHTFSGLAAATYQIRVRNDNAQLCEAASGAVAVTITQPTAVTSSPTSTITCTGGSTGTITVNAAGGTGAYTYSLDGVTFPYSASPITGLPAATYQLVVKDANGCLSSATPVTVGATSTVTFTGAVSTNWYVAGNWSPACVPSNTLSAIIPTGFAVQIATGTAAVFNLDIQGAGTLTVSGTGNLNVNGTFTVAGAGSFTATVGTTNFLGSGAQPIPAGTYFNVTVTGATAKVLTGAPLIGGTLNLSAGNIDLGAFDLTMNDPLAGPLTSIIGYDATHYLRISGAGRLVYTRTGINATARSTVFFPIGTALSYTPAELTFTAGTNYVAPARASVSDVVPVASPAGPVSHVVNKTWNVSWGAGTLPAGALASLQLRWNAPLATPSGDESVFFNRASCTVAHYENMAWNHRIHDYAPAQTVAGQWARTRYQLTTFSPFALADDFNPLPVELVGFTAERKGTDALLKWTTASEQNSRGFEVQVSLDNKTFRKLGFVESETPGSATTRHYQFVDREAGKSGVRYYRLLPTDLDGTTTASDVVALSFTGDVTTSVTPRPNPFTDQFGVEVNAASTGAVQLTLVDALGREVLNQTLPVIRGHNVLAPVLPTRLAPGTYTLVTAVDGQRFYSRLLKH